MDALQQSLYAVVKQIWARVRGGPSGSLKGLCRCPGGSLDVAFAGIFWLSQWLGLPLTSGAWGVGSSHRPRRAVPSKTPGRFYVNDGRWLDRAGVSRVERREKGSWAGLDVVLRVRGRPLFLPRETRLALAPLWRGLIHMEPNFSSSRYATDALKRGLRGGDRSVDSNIYKVLVSSQAWWVSHLSGVVLTSACCYPYKSIFTWWSSWWHLLLLYLNASALIHISMQYSQLSACLIVSPAVVPRLINPFLYCKCWHFSSQFYFAATGSAPMSIFIHMSFCFWLFSWENI